MNNTLHVAGTHNSTPLNYTPIHLHTLSGVAGGELHLL